MTYLVKNPMGKNQLRSYLVKNPMGKNQLRSYLVKNPMGKNQLRYKPSKENYVWMLQKELFDVVQYYNFVIIHVQK